MRLSALHHTGGVCKGWSQRSPGNKAIYTMLSALDGSYYFIQASKTNCDYKIKECALTESKNNYDSALDTVRQLCGIVSTLSIVNRSQNSIVRMPG